MLLALSVNNLGCLKVTGLPSSAVQGGSTATFCPCFVVN